MSVGGRQRTTLFMETGKKEKEEPKARKGKGRR